MKNKYVLVSIICFTVAICCLLFGITGWLEQRRAGEEYETLLSELESQTETESEEISETETVESESTETTEETLIQETEQTSETTKGFYTREDIDFDALQKLNPDIYAWIEVPGTNVDYPIVQHPTDNGYYLTHTVEHKKTTAASIYTERYNSKDFEDAHTVIYGHNMKNGSMFRTLHNFEDYEFFEENRDIVIYMPEQTLYYEIFAAYTYDNRHLLNTYNCSEPEEFSEYLEEVFSIKDFGAFIDHEMEVTSKDRIITLSTCVNSGNSAQRYLVQAVLVSIES